MSMLPYLMRYMGHSSIEKTYYYIHLIPDYFGNYAEMCIRDSILCLLFCAGDLSMMNDRVRLPSLSYLSQPRQFIW